MGFNFQLRSQFSSTQNLYKILFVDQAMFGQRVHIYVLQFVTLGQIMNRIEVDSDKILADRILETEFRYLSLQGHLSSFKTDLVGILLSGYGTLVPSGGGTSAAGDGTTSNSFPLFYRNFCRCKCT